MISVEVCFRIDGREVSAEKFASFFVGQAIHDAFGDLLPKVTPPEASASRAVLPEPPLKPEPRAVSKKEAARLLGICVRTVDTWISTRKIASVRFGRRVLIPTKAIDEVLRRATLPPLRDSINP
jgi:excisionase family DNA binding protein